MGKVTHEMMPRPGRAIESSCARRPSFIGPIRLVLHHPASCESCHGYTGDATARPVASTSKSDSCIYTNDRVFESVLMVKTLGHTVGVSPFDGPVGISPV